MEWSTKQSKELEILLRAFNGEEEFEGDGKSFYALKNNALISINSMTYHSDDPDDTTDTSCNLSITLKGALEVETLVKSYQKIYRQ